MMEVLSAIEPIFRRATDAEIADRILRLPDVGLSDESPDYQTPSVWDSVRRLPRKMKPWSNAVGRELGDQLGGADCGAGNNKDRYATTPISFRIFS